MYLTYQKGGVLPGEQMVPSGSKAHVPEKEKLQLHIDANYDH